ncbi:MAG: HU family DNA-binding protein [Desulfovibrio desulfuricans]|jgi:DNA-binding protein HU-beta|nr:HU family DNA-binding protein [Desulfovibrio desulfuricans]
MTKTELVKLVAAKSGLTDSKAAACISAMLSTITSELDAGNDVPLPGLGKLVVKERAARQGRNPRTGKELTIPACKIVSLRTCKEFKENLNG